MLKDQEMRIAEIVDAHEKNEEDLKSLHEKELEKTPQQTPLAPEINEPTEITGLETSTVEETEQPSSFVEESTSINEVTKTEKEQNPTPQPQEKKSIIGSIWELLQLGRKGTPGT